jgi:hypothetical protein
VGSLIDLLRRAQLEAATAGMVAMICANSFSTRQRMSHLQGVLARGRIRVVDDPTFPEHDFFRPGREFACRLRHASAAFQDEALLTVRAASLKFADAEYDSPFDLEMNTGDAVAFCTARQFWQFMLVHLAGHGDAYRTYFGRYPLAMRSAQLGVRRNPESFAKLIYESQVPIRFTARDGRRRYVKFRMLPAEGGPETGIPEAWETDDVVGHEMTRLPGDTRPRNYLSAEFARRLSEGPVGYRLQLQLHEARPDDSPEILNCSRPWEEASHPWQELASVEIRQHIPYRQGNRTIFSITHQPPSLGLLPARSLDDYNSLNYVRARSLPAKQLRLLSYRLFGMPADVPAETPPATEAVPART